VLIAIAVVAIILLAVVGLLVSARKRSTTGSLSRETRQRDEAAAASALSSAEETAAVETSEGRERADEARQAIESGASAVPAPVTASTPAVYEPVDLDELGVTRRQFFNRSLLAGTGLGLGAFGVSALAFLWPSAAAGFGGKITVGGTPHPPNTIDKKKPL